MLSLGYKAIISTMFFDDFELHKDAKVRDSLLWEYELDNFDYHDMRTVVVQRVVERGRMEDYYAILNLYGINGVREAIKEIPCLNAKDISFVCSVFDLNKEDLKCYIRKQSLYQH